MKKDPFISTPPEQKEVPHHLYALLLLTLIALLLGGILVFQSIPSSHASLQGFPSSPESSPTNERTVFTPSFPQRLSLLPHTSMQQKSLVPSRSFSPPFHSKVTPSPAMRKRLPTPSHLASPHTPTRTAIVPTARVSPVPTRVPPIIPPSFFDSLIPMREASAGMSRGAKMIR